MNHDLYTLKNDIVKKSFPELKEQKIFIRYKKMSDAYFLYDDESKPTYNIFVSTDIKRHPPIIVVGGIAHELCHIVSDLNMSKYMSEKDEELYKRNPQYRKLDERNTDLQTILRGYGKELYALNSLRRIKGMANGGLTPKEIEQLIRKR